MFLEDRCCLQCQRTVYKDLKSVMIFHQMFFLDLTDKIQHFLRSAHCKGRDHQIASPVKGPLHDRRQLLHIIRLRTMAPVTICGFHHHIIRLFQIFRITKQRLMFVSDIAGKYDLFLCSLFCHPDFNGGRSEEMPCIQKTDLHIFVYMILFLIRQAYQALDRSFCIVHIIQRKNLCFSGSSTLSVSPLRLKHLNMRTVTQHNLRQISGRFCGKDLSTESSLI